MANAKLLNVLLRLDGVYEISANQQTDADYCLIPLEFQADELPAMTNRASGHGYALNIVEEPAPETPKANG